MKDEMHKIEELASLYLAGALTPKEAEDVEQRLLEGDDELRAAVLDLDPAARALFESSPSTPVPPDVRDALLAKVAKLAESSSDSIEYTPSNPQVWKQWDDDTADISLLIRRAGDAAWEPTGIDGIESRPLFVDRERDQTTMMVRMAPGTAYPRHLHAGPEECFVLEGDLRVGNEVLRAGDYQRAAAGSHHPVQSTEGGCLLLLVSSLSDELD